MYLGALRVSEGDGISGSPRGVTPREMGTLGDAGRGVGVSQTVLVARTGGFQPQRRWEQGGGPPGPPSGRARCQPQGTSRCVRHSRHRPPGHNLPGPISAAAPQPRLRGPDLIPAQPPLGGQGNPSASRRDGAAGGAPGWGAGGWRAREWGAKGMEKSGMECTKDGRTGNGASGGWRAQEWSRETGDARNGLQGDGNTGNRVHEWWRAQG